MPRPALRRSGTAAPFLKANSRTNNIQHSAAKYCAFVKKTMSRQQKDLFPAVVRLMRQEACNQTTLLLNTTSLSMPARVYKGIYESCDSSEDWVKWSMPWVSITCILQSNCCLVTSCKSLVLDTGSHPLVHRSSTGHSRLFEKDFRQHARGWS